MLKLRRRPIFHGQCVRGMRGWKLRASMRHFLFRLRRRYIPERLWGVVLCELQRRNGIVSDGRLRSRRMC